MVKMTCLHSSDTTQLTPKVLSTKTEGHGIASSEAGQVNGSRGCDKIYLILSPKLVIFLKVLEEQVRS